LFHAVRVLSSRVLPIPYVRPASGGSSLLACAWILAGSTLVGSGAGVEVAWLADGVPVAVPATGGVPLSPPRLTAKITPIRISATASSTTRITLPFGCPGGR